MKPGHPTGYKSFVIRKLVSSIWIAIKRILVNINIKIVENQCY